MKSTLEDGVLKISPANPLAGTNLSEHATALSTALQSVDEGGLAEIDLSRSGILDSQAIRLLLAADADCRRRSIELQIMASEENAGLFRLLKLDRRLKFATPEDKS